MKQKVLLLDDSLTVQKVVALSLDRGTYHVLFAKNQPEALRVLTENEMGVVLVSENVAGLTASSFPKEVELRLGRSRKVPPMILISSRAVSDTKNYAGALQKPFTPQALCQMIEAVLGHTAPGTDESPRDIDEQRLQKIFNDAFPHESLLAVETIKHSQAEAASQSRGIPLTEEPVRLWDSLVDNLGGDDRVPIQENAPVRKNSALAREASALENLDAIVAKKLDQVLPAIVERLVQERLDKLLSSSEKFDEIKA